MKTKKLNSSRNLFILTDIGFSKRDQIRFEISLLKKYFNIYIFDFTLLNSKKFYKIKRKSIISNLNYYLSRDYELDYKKILNLSNKKKNYCLDLLSNKSKSIQLRNKLKLRKFKFIFYEIGLFPLPNLIFKEKFSKLIYFIKKRKFKKIYFKIKEKIFDRNKKQNFVYDYLISTGLYCKNNYKKKILSYSSDFSLFQKTKKKNIFFHKKKYMLFIDQNYPNHPGQKYRNKSKNINKKKYYTELNLILKKISEQTNLKVLIASHPTTQIEILKKYLNFDIIKGNTNSLIRKAELVITHTSTAISFAILYNKPILFLTNDDITKSYDGFLPETLARILNSKCINMSLKNNSVINMKQFKIDKSKYKKYINLYIKHPKASLDSPFKSLIKQIVN